MNKGETTMSEKKIPLPIPQVPTEPSPVRENPPPIVP